MKDVILYEQQLRDGIGRVCGKVAILWGGTKSDEPKSYMELACDDYVKHADCNKYIDHRLSFPWLIVVIKGLSEVNFERYTIDEYPNAKVYISRHPLLDKDKVETIGEMAILVGGVGTNKPNEIVNSAVKKYISGGVKYNELIDKNLDNPWVRVIITNIDQIPFKNYTTQQL